MDRKLVIIIGSIFIALLLSRAVYFVSGMGLFAPATSGPKPRASAEADHARPEKQFAIPIDASKGVSASLYPGGPYGADKKVVTFSSPLKGDDAHLYMAALTTAAQMHSDRPAFFRGDGRSEYRSDMGGEAICWQGRESPYRFYTFPVKDAATGDLAALVVWWE